jgi:hypothetical protein
VVDEAAYLLELTRYLHLNPVRATVLPDLRTLDRHSGLLGTVPRPWQATQNSEIKRLRKAAAKAQGTRQESS